MKFSEKKNYVKKVTEIQVDTMRSKLRNKLWNIFEGYSLRKIDPHKNNNVNRYSKPKFIEDFYIDILDKPIDTISLNWGEVVRKYFFECDWYIVYDILELALKRDLNKKFLQEELNDVLEQELSGYRFVNGICTDITAPEEIEMLEAALNDNIFPGVRKHLRKALELLSNKDNPDYSNSIKESISAVESLCQIITGKPKATLPDALKALKNGDKIHPALLQGFINIYGYTSDADGIRHALNEVSDLNANDAKFFLLSCTSFINYLKTKM